MAVMTGFLITMMFIAEFVMRIGGQQCIEDINVQVQRSNLTVPQRRQVIIPRSNFSCHGRATSFVVHLSTEIKNGSSNPRIQIWRPVGENVYTRLKEFSIDKPNDEQLVINVTGGAGVVEPNDCIGYYQPSDSRLVRNIQTNDTGYTSYVITANDSLGDFSINNNTENIPLQPVITVMFEIQCNNLSTPSNGEIASCSSGREGVGYEGDTCNFTCNTGYELTGSDTRTCRSNGSWSGSVTECVRVHCSLPTYGTLHCPNETTTGVFEDTCTFSCNGGYELQGPNNGTCLADQSWSGGDPICIVLNCSTSPPLDNSQLQLPCDTQYQSTCTTVCVDGYTGGGGSYTCDVTDVAINSVGWRGTTSCQRVNCSALNNSIDGIITCSLGDDGVPSYEDTCSFTCNTGYEVTGSDTSTCQSDGKWSDSDDVCRRVSCPSLTNPNNGMTTCSLGDDGVPSYEDTCSFTCNTGYELTGSDTRTCQSNGSWSGTDNVCRRVPCPSLTDPNNGMITCSLGDDGVPSYEDTCSFTCNTGYELTGSDTRTCQSNGSWSGSDDVCRRAASKDETVVTPAIVGAVIAMSIILILSVILCVIIVIKKRRRRSYKCHYNNEKNLSPNQYPVLISQLNVKKRSTIHPPVSMENPSYAEILPDNSVDQTDYTCALYSTPVPHAVMHKGKKTSSRISVQPYEAPADTKSNCYMSISSNYAEPLFDDTTDDYSVPKDVLKSLKKHQRSKYSMQLYMKPARELKALLAQLKKCEVKYIKQDDIRLVKELGSGEFGLVSLATWKDKSTQLQVAVKVINSEASEIEKVKFLQEAAIMCQFCHSNVIGLLGIVMEESLAIVLEYALRGDLKTVLFELKSNLLEDGKVADTLPTLFLSFARQIAAGMNYLSNKNFVHRDLAARNVLITEEHICKIADFGLARDLEQETVYITTGGKIPVKWTAPEAMQFRKFSTLSDVWSFGCVLFEIWSLGSRLYENISRDDVLNRIVEGYRLPPPPGCPKPIYKLMIRCWHPNQESRPHFVLITEYLKKSVEQLLNIRDEDYQFYGSEALTLGLPLSSSHELYEELQHVYVVL